MFSNKTSFAVISKFAAVFAIFSASVAAAAPVSIKQVQVAENDRVDLLLDGKLDASQIRTEFFNDIIQLSLTDTAVYPAKISSVSGKELSKIFVYQYAPKLVRVRLTVNGKADSFQNRIQVKPNGKMLTIRLDGKSSADKPGSDKVATVAAQAQKPSASASGDSAEADERALLEKVLKNPVARTPEPAAETPRDTIREARAESALAKPAVTGGTTDVVTSRKSEKRGSKQESLGGKQDIVSPWKALMGLLGVVLCFGMVALTFKKFLSTKGANGALNRWVRKSLGKKDQMIEVLAMHQLGPKKSIHMVRVAGRTLVLGVAEDSINLISELGSGSLASGTGATSRDFSLPVAAAAGATSADSDFLSELGEQLAQESGRTTAPAVAYSASPAAVSPRISARDRIRSRLEGMKQL